MERGDGDVGHSAVQREVFGHEPPVRLVYLHGYSGPAEAVAATFGVAALSFLTGLAHLTGGPADVQGAFARYVPAGFHRVVGFSDVLFAFLLLAVAGCLHWRFRAGYHLALGLVGLSGLQSVVAWQTVDVPLVFACVAALAVLGRNRDAFDRRVDPSSVQVAAVLAILAAQLYGTVGTFALREEFSGVRTAADALYFVVAGTAGGDPGATPVSMGAKLFTLSVLVVGTASFTAALGAVAVPAIETRLADAVGTMTQSPHETFDDHVVVLGAGSLTAPVLAALDDRQDAVVLARDPAAVSTPADDGATVVAGDPTEEAALREAGLPDARAAVAASDDDARDALAVIAAAACNPEVRIVAAASDADNVPHLADAGAGTVVSPTAVGGTLLGRAVHGHELPPDLPVWGRDDERSDDGGNDGEGE